MPLREIISPAEYSHPVREVVSVTPAERSLIQDLKDTAELNSLNCLSAPRLGSSKKIMVLRSGPTDEFVTLINPVILGGIGEKVVIETDSLTGEDKFSQFAAMVLVEYQAENLENIQQMFTDYCSYSIQSEVNRFENRDA